MEVSQKLKKGFLNNFIENAGSHIITFAFGIILARLLTPEDYGLVAVLAIFIDLSVVLTDSGISSSIIQKKEIKEIDLSTAFVFYLFVSSVLYAILFLSSGFISDYYNYGELSLLIKIYGILIIINSYNFIQNTVSNRNLEFKVLMKINLSSRIISSVIAVIFAFLNFGFWSLIIKSISESIIKSLLFYLKGRYIPKFDFDLKTFKTHFKFGVNILFADGIGAVFNNLYSIIIPKLFSLQELGYYNRAKNYSDLVTRNFSSVFYNVTFPTFSRIQDDKVLLKSLFRKSLVMLSFIIFSLSIYLFISSDSLILVLLTDKWQNSIHYLRLLSISGIFFPLLSIGNSLFMSLGKARFTLKFEIIKKIILVIAIIFLYHLGVTGLIIAILIQLFISFIISVIYFNKLIKYTFIEIFSDMLPIFVITIISGLFVSLIINSLHNNLFPDKEYFILIEKTLLFWGLIIFFSYIFKLNALNYIRTFFATKKII